MNYGGDAADQIVRYSLDGVDHGLRLSGTLAKHLAVFVAAVLKDQKKTRGKTRMVRMLKENKPLKFFGDLTDPDTVRFAPVEPLPLFRECLYPLFQRCAVGE